VREEIKAGIIVCTSLLLLSASVILIGGSRFFEKFDVYYVRVMNVGGLETGAQVRLGGVKVGRVLAITAPSGSGKPVTIEIGLKRGTPVFKGTRALITQIGFVGDIYVLLAVDQTTEGRILPGEEIPSEKTSDFARMMGKLEDLSQSLDGLIRDADRVFSAENVHKIESLLATANKALMSGSSNFEEVASAFKSTNERLELVLSEVESLVKENKGEVSQLIMKARQDLDKAAEMMKSIETAAKSIDKTTATAGRTIDLQSRNLDMLIDAMTKSTEDLRDVLQEIKRKPWSILYKEGKSE
jgi:phospholipid/cholesterol/gamma-HCH transport system substrate-binding protein